MTQTLGVVPAPITRVYHHDDFDPRRLARAKAGTSVSVCLPARDEAATVGRIVEVLRTELIEGAHLVDEIVVMDDWSADATAEIAEAAGARVARTADVLAQFGRGGKGEALWKSVHVAEGDVIVWCDADIVNFEARFVTGLLGPLLTHPDIAFVKGFYDRPLLARDVLEHGEGGRVTELTARPLLSLLHPHLATIVQPLAGEYGGRREVLEAVPFVQGYGVDLGLLIDVVQRFGLDGICQVDLGTRQHRNRPLADLGPMAMAVAQTALAKSALATHDVEEAALVRPGAEPFHSAHIEHPPLVSVPAYMRRRRVLDDRERTA